MAEVGLQTAASIPAGEKPKAGRDVAVRFRNHHLNSLT